MKTYEEKTQCVFEKMEAEKQLQIARRKTVKRIAAPAISLCLVAVIGFGAWQTGVFQKLPTLSSPGESGVPIPNPDGTIQREEMPETIPTQPILRPGDEGYIGPGPTPIPVPPADDTATVNDAELSLPTPEPEISGTPRADNTEVQESGGIFVPANIHFIQWGNKTVLADLANALSEAPADKVFEILAHPYIDYTFMYEGRTLAEYYSDMCDERNLPEVLTQLLKEGNALKYGTALYEVGTPDGEKWAQSFYEERIAFYGQAILGKYIVDGQFLEEQVESDLENAKTAQEATKIYKAAFAAYYRHLVDTLQISVPADVKGTSGIILHMTAEEFKSFTPDKVEAWSFSWENADNTTVFNADTK